MTKQKAEEVVPDVVVGPNDKITWLNQVGEELEEWVAYEKDVMSHKGMREACAEAVRIKRDIEKDTLLSSLCYHFVYKMKKCKSEGPSSLEE